MAKHDASTAECLVFTFKEGLLSKIAHDLKIRVTRFSVQIDDATRAITAEIDARSLRVVNAVKDGQDDPSSLSEADKDKIAGQIVDEVLHANQYPVVRFESTSVTPVDGGYDVSGDLTLHGVTRPISTRTRLENGRQVAEVLIHQPDYGVKPFKALMGTLKVQPGVRVRFSVPA
ncbi:MAG TPA: YceI family protein [Haliangium sp.]|nr:YceI family protein [Haliangium sp.]